MEIATALLNNQPPKFENGKGTKTKERNKRTTYLSPSMTSTEDTLTNCSKNERGRHEDRNNNQPCGMATELIFVFSSMQPSVFQLLTRTGH